MRLLRGAVFACLAALPLAFAQQESSSSAAASALSVLPECAANCFVSAVERSTCELTDQKCMCTNTALQQDIEGCVMRACTIPQGLVTKNATLTACGAPIRDHSPQFIVLNEVMAIITGIFIIQRFGTKLYWKLPLGLDDLFIALTMCVAIPSIVINSRGLAPNGMGRDIWTVTPDQITQFGMFFYTMAILYFSLQTFLKLSMLFFYLRIFPTQNVRRLLWGTVAFTVLFGLVFIFVAVFQCRPINYFWLKWDGQHEGKCADINAVTWSNAAINIALDFWILAIPLSQLKSLNLDWRKKIGVGMMFSVGIFVTIMSILRLHATVQAGVKTTNATWEYLAVSKWSTIEGNVGIICACMPSLRILLVRLFPKILGTSQRYYNYGSRSNKQTPGNTHNRSIPLGTNATSQADRSQRRVDPVGIECHRTYEVEYGDNDETYLVHMKDMDHKSARSEVRSETSL
ncbi:integral membrane protein PTH11 [Fusarium sp. NRRL 52700]|nr:integral membrane protein PTH11 [Fusarium sp. NRRL 52700]